MHIRNVVYAHRDQTLCSEACRLGESHPLCIRVHPRPAEVKSSDEARCEMGEFGCTSASLLPPLSGTKSQHSFPTIQSIEQTAMVLWKLGYKTL